MKTPIRYWGGKGRLAPVIVRLIPKHRVYVEPFTGGGAVLFAKPYPHTFGKVNGDYIEVVNDLDGRVTNFYEQLRDNHEELVPKLQLTQDSAREYARCRDMGEHIPAVERARRFYVRSFQGFAMQGLNPDGGAWGRIACRNRALEWMQMVDRLPEIAARLRPVTVTSEDALACIKKWDAPDAFFYIDPPYVDTDQPYAGTYAEKDWRALVDLLGTIQGSYILSHYPVAYEPAFTIEIERKIVFKHKLTGEDRDRTEVLWCHYNDWTPPKKRYDYEVFSGSEILARSMQRTVAAAPPSIEYDPDGDDDDATPE